MFKNFRICLGLQWFCIGNWNSGSRVTPLVLFSFSFWLLLLLLLLFLSVVLAKCLGCFAFCYGSQLVGILLSSSWTEGWAQSRLGWAFLRGRLGGFGGIFILTFFFQPPPRPRYWSLSLQRPWCFYLPLYSGFSGWAMCCPL